MSDKALLVLHAVPDLRLSAGGIAGILPGLCAALAKQGVESRLLSFALDEDSPLAEQTQAVFSDRSLFRLPPYVAEGLTRLRDEAKRDGRKLVCHSHGLWSPLNHALAKAARKQEIPLVISLHGMLLPWALRHKAFRKRVAWQLYQAADLAQARAVHVTSRDERKAALIAGVKAPISIIPFGIAPPPAHALRPRSAGSVQGRRTLLFLGRIHPIKNLATLIEAFAGVRPEGCRMIIAGPDEIGYQSELERLAAARGIGECVSFEGPVYGDAKSELFARADVLVLPSHSENFGAVVAEALAHGVPALASTGTPWAALLTEGCGWWVPPGREPLAAAIQDISRRDASSLHAMGARGRAYVERNLTWQASSKRIATLYRQLSTPHCSELEALLAP